MTTLSLQFPLAEVANLAARYDYADDAAVLAIGREAGARGFFTRDEFLAVCHWKSPRPTPRVVRNAADAIEEMTRVALSAGTEELRILGPQILEGVSWPTASVLLHIAHHEPYPILDYRALEALGVSPAPTYAMAFWLEYVHATRLIATQAGVDMRTLDRALWQWSRERRSGPEDVAKATRTRRSAPNRGPATSPLARPERVDAVILGCVSSKRRARSKAKDLYISPLWRKRRAYAERTGLPWVIFSAMHGILDPDQAVDWYDVALARLPTVERSRKGEDAVAQLVDRFGSLRGLTFEIHAGSAYATAI